MAEGLIPREVGKIKERFYIESYQRGYRWGRDEVTRLLEDIYTNGTRSYCLQPVVVKKCDKADLYELIDGQQRLTTIYLLYQYMWERSNHFLGGAKFSIDYRTRENSADFLKNIDLVRREENIDFWFMAEAYETISDWFRGKENSDITDINKYLDQNVRIIWYEVPEEEDSIALFNRLNIGKIQLTSAELVKAMFLSRDINEGLSREKQEEISLQWDQMERELHNEEMWFFLTNDTAHSCQTRIDLILDIISGKRADERDRYFTFFYFDRKKKESSLTDIWRDIQHTFLLLKDWFENHELYHKIGYLIASGHMGLHDIFNLSQGRTKREFRKALDGEIRSSIAINKNYSELTYEKSGDKNALTRLLLLFNVESVRRLDEEAQRFPFHLHKNQGTWTLEHIHAQQSEGLRSMSHWKEWLELHIRSIENIGDSGELIPDMRKAIEDPRLTREDFETIQQEVWSRLSDGDIGYLHHLSNLALLNSGDNAALSNSTFDVKRSMIIDMDKHGRYIPFCTKMVFMKYYTGASSRQIHFWSQEDREAYINAVNKMLYGDAGYLEESISSGVKGE